MTVEPDVLFSQEQIRARVAEVGGEISRTFDGAPVCVVGVMKSCMVFMADLIRYIPSDMTCHFLRVSSLRDEGCVRTDIVYSTEIPYEGRHILLLMDIIDTGITLNFLVEHILERKPKMLKVCTLIDKPQDRKIDVHPDWAAFSVGETGDRFIVGYGLDFAEHYRGLPYLATIPRPTPPSEERTVALRL
ncbi:MAG: hypoxanthine phosphoribosyltransferase [Vicinamibacteria bacterium]